MSKDLEVRHIALEWMVNFAFYNAWKEFSSSYTVEKLVNRDLIQGLLHSIPNEKEKLNFQALLLVLFCKLADGEDNQLDSAPIEETTPLEHAMMFLENIRDTVDPTLHSQLDVVIGQTREQAVLTCCRKNRFDLAAEVLNRIFPVTTTDTDKSMHATLHSMIQSKGTANSPLISSKYEDYLQEVVRLFKEVLKSHEKSFLVKLAEFAFEHGCSSIMNAIASDRAEPPTIISGRVLYKVAKRFQTTDLGASHPLYSKSSAVYTRRSSQQSVDQDSPDPAASTQQTVKEKSVADPQVVDSACAKQPHNERNSTPEKQPNQERISTPKRQQGPSRGSTPDRAGSPPAKSPIKRRRRDSRSKPVMYTTSDTDSDVNGAGHDDVSHVSASSKTTASAVPRQPLRGRHQFRRNVNRSDRHEVEQQTNVTSSTASCNAAGGDAPRSNADADVIESGTPSTTSTSTSSYHVEPTGTPSTTSTSTSSYHVEPTGTSSTTAAAFKAARKALPPMRQSLAPKPPPRSADSDDDDAASLFSTSSLPSPHRRAARRRSKNPWLRSETEELYRLVQHLGEGCWADIKKAGKFPNRTNVHLKDRWRTVLKSPDLLRELQIKFGEYE